MQYNGLYFALFRGTMKKVLTERYGKNFAKKTMREASSLYQRIVREADDLGKGNPMAYNELFALAFVAPYLACGKQITPEDVQEMMRRSLYHVKWYFSMVDLNTGKGKAANQKSILKYVNWYTPEREKQYPTSFRVDFVGKPHENACYYRITRCPICACCAKLGVSELMPLLCELDEVMIGLQHGVLYRQYTIASGGPYCDYYIVGDRETSKEENARDGTV